MGDHATDTKNSGLIEVRFRSSCALYNNCTYDYEYAGAYCGAVERLRTIDHPAA